MDRIARLTVLGSLNMDISVTVPALPAPGATVLGGAASFAPGGKGANQAVAAARAGARVQFVGAVGDDPGADQLREHLEANGVGLDGTVAVSGPSGSAIIVVDATAHNTIVVAPGANARLSLNDAMRAVIKNCDVLLTQLEIPLSTATAAAHEARSAGAVVIVNASPAGRSKSLLSELAEIADVVIANEGEAAEWRWQPHHLVTTLGARGARWVTPDHDFWVPAPPVKAVDTTGAGDVFAGVLAANWPRDPKSRAERLAALQRAVAAGALSTLVRGAGDCAPDAEAIDATVRAEMD